MPNVDSGAGGTAGLDGGTVSAGTGGSDRGNEGGSGGGLSLGDFDHLSSEYPATPPGSSSSFFWGGPNGIHLGNWFVASASGFADDAPVDAIEPPRGDSTLACHVSGAQFARGLDLFAELNHPASTPVSLSGYAGLAFWARAASPAQLTVFLNDGTGSLKKEGSWAGLLSGSFALSPEWQRFEVAFTDPGRVSDVAKIDFVVLNGGEGIDLWIDDPTLLCQEHCQ